MITLIEKPILRIEKVGIDDTITREVPGALIFNPSTKMVEMWDKEANKKVGEVLLAYFLRESWKVLSNEVQQILLDLLKG